MRSSSSCFGTRRGPLTALLALLATVACDVPTVPPLQSESVYEFRLATSPPLTLRWPIGASIRVFVVDGGARGDLLRASAQEGAIAWNRHALLDEYELVITDSPTDADVLLAWSDEPLPVDTSACPRTPGRGVTTFCLNGAELYRYPFASGESSSVRMLMTVAVQLASSPDLLRASVAHELGHVLGIGRHSDDAGDLMWHSDPTRATPSLRDVATVRALYRTDADVQP